MESIKLGDLSTPIALKNTLNKMLEQAPETLKQDVEVLKQDTSVLKQDVNALNLDSSELKQDNITLKQDTEILKQDVGVLKSVLIQDKIVATAVDKASYDTRITGGTLSSKIVNDSRAKVLRIDGKSVRNYCPILNIAITDNTIVKLRMTYNGEVFERQGAYLSVQNTDNGIEIRLKEGAILSGHEFAGLYSIDSITMTSGVVDIVLDESKTYYVSCESEIGAFSLSGQSNGETQTYSSGDTITGVSVLSLSTAQIYIPNDTLLFTDENQVLVLKPMINEGTSALPYVPMGSTKNSKIKAIKSYGNNLIPYPYKFSETIFNGVTYTVNFDGSITMKGTATSGSGLDFLTYTSATAPKFQVGTTYVLSGSQQDTSIMVRKNPNDAYGATSKNGSTQTFTISAGQYIWCVRVIPQKGVTYNTTIYPMINIGDQAFPFMPYGVSDTLTIDENGIELAEGETYAPNPNEYNVWTNGTETVEVEGDIYPTIVTDYLTIV